MGKELLLKKLELRLGKTLLELGGNNAIIVTPDADLKMTIMGYCFWSSWNLWSKMYIDKKINCS